MNVTYLQRLTPKKLEQQAKRAAIHRALGTHGHGKGSPFSLRNQRIQAHVSRLRRASESL